MYIYIYTRTYIYIDAYIYASEQFRNKTGNLEIASTMYLFYTRIVYKKNLSVYFYLNIFLFLFLNFEKRWRQDVILFVLYLKVSRRLVLPGNRERL